MPENSGNTKTYENEISVPKYNIAGLSEAEIQNEIEYLLFVEHAEDMKGYVHLQPLIKEVAKLVIQISDRAVEGFQDRMVHRIASHLRDEVATVVYGAKTPTRDKGIVKTTIDDEKVVEQTVEVKPSHDW